MKDSAANYGGESRLHNGASAIACRAVKRLCRSKKATTTGSGEVAQHQVPHPSSGKLWKAKDKEILARAFEDFNPAKHLSKNQKFQQLQEKFVALGGDKSRSWRAVEGKTRNLWRAKQLVLEDDCAPWFNLSDAARRDVVARKALDKMLLLMSPGGELRALDKLVGNSQLEVDNAATAPPPHDPVGDDSMNGAPVGEVALDIDVVNAAIIPPLPFTQVSTNGTAVWEEGLGGEDAEVGNSSVCQLEVDNTATVPPADEPICDNSMNSTVGEQALAEEAGEDVIPAAETAPGEDPSRGNSRPATSDVEEGVGTGNPTREVHESGGSCTSATLGRIAVRELRITSREGEQRRMESAAGILMASANQPQAKRRRLFDQYVSGGLFTMKLSNAHMKAKNEFVFGS